MAFPKCEECGFGYDSKDPRAHTTDKMRMCPLCLAMLNGHTEWAITNDCNGVFETRPRRKDALDLLAKEYADVDARVVPVKIVEIEGTLAADLAGCTEDEFEKYAG